MIQLFNDIKQQILNEVPEIQFVQMYNSQFADMDRDERGASIYSFPLPAAFIEFEDDLQYLQLGNGVQLIDPLFIKIHIAHEYYDAQDGTMEQNLEIFNLRQKVYMALQKFEPNGAVAFMRINETQDKHHTNLYHYIQTYQTNFIDSERQEPVNGVIKDPPTDLDLTVSYDPSPYLKGGGGSGPIPPQPIGDIFVDEFNPKVGTYVDLGTSVTSISSGNMAISGGDGFFQNITEIQDVVWNGNNWYLESEYSCTNTNAGEFSVVFGLKSINAAEAQSVGFGIYYFNATNNGLLYIFNGHNLNSGPINTPSLFPITIASGNNVKVYATFIESVLTVTVNNLSIPDSVSAQLDYGYTLSEVNFKPNTGKLFIMAPQSTANIKYIKFGSEYLESPDFMVQGDSISSGYYQNSEAQRFINVYATATGKTWALMAGSSDRTIECSNTTALSNYTKFKPKKVLYFAGTNDVANGVPILTTIANIDLAKSAWESTGAEFWIAVPLPRNGVNTAALRAAILAQGYPNVIDWYSHFEDPMNPGHINPLYSDDGIHFNALGAIEAANFLQSNNF